LELSIDRKTSLLQNHPMIDDEGFNTIVDEGQKSVNARNASYCFKLVVGLFLGATLLLFLGSFL